MESLCQGDHFVGGAVVCSVPDHYRQLEEMMGERGVPVDHSTLNRWVVKYAPEIEKQFRRRQRAVGRS
jgi:putative transposase